MLIAIGVLALVVVYLANKPMPGDQTVPGNGLPPPSPIPATGTTGVPSPATAFGGFGHPLLATNIGQMVMSTNSTLPGVTVPAAQTAPGVLPAPGTVSSAPIGPPGQSKDLTTQSQPATLQSLAAYNGKLRQL